MCSPKDTPCTCHWCRFHRSFTFLVFFSFVDETRPFRQKQNHFLNDGGKTNTRTFDWNAMCVWVLFCYLLSIFSFASFSSCYQFAFNGFFFVTFFLLRQQSFILYLTGRPEFFFLLPRIQLYVGMGERERAVYCLYRNPCPSGGVPSKTCLHLNLLLCLVSICFRSHFYPKKHTQTTLNGIVSSVRVCFLLRMKH